MKTDTRAALMATTALLFTTLACDKPAPPQDIDAIFVRGGVIYAGEGPGTLVGGAANPGENNAQPRRFIERDWTPGERISLGKGEAIAPAAPECVPLFQVPLGDISSFIAAGGTSPDTALAFSPDGRRLAIGSYKGEVIVVDAYTGAPIAKRSFEESVIKALAFSPDGATLYAAEQSPDALVHALDATTLKSTWAYRLADDIGSSPLPPGEDLYGLYTLPTAYGLTLLPGGDLIVAASHGWSPKGAPRRNQSRILRLTPKGEVAFAFPKNGAADAIFMHPEVDPGGELVIFTVHRSAEGEPADTLPFGGILALSLKDLTPRFEHVADPLPPHFKSANIWEAIDVSSDANSVLLGYGDGRVRLLGLDGSLNHQLTTGTPVMAGDVPIAAGVSFGQFVGASAFYITSETVIPFGSASPDLRPPSTHPRENTLFVMSPEGEPRWTWNGPFVLAGLTPGPKGKRLALGAGARSRDKRRDLYGALVFDLKGDERVEPTHCPTEGPVFFHQALSADGRVAVVEYPYLKEDDTQVGAYRVTLLR